MGEACRPAPGPRRGGKSLSFAGDPCPVARLAGAPLALSWSPDGTELAAGGAAPEAVVVRLAARQPTVVYAGHDGAVDLAWSPDGEWLAIAGLGSVTVRSTGSTATEARLETRGWSPRLAWAPDRSALAAVAGQDLTILRPDGTLLCERPWQGTDLHSVCWPKPDLVAVGATGGVRWFDPDQAQLVMESRSDGAVVALAPAATGRTLAAGNLDGTVRLFDTDADEATEMSDYSSGAELLSWNGDRLLAVASADEATVWRVDGVEVTGEGPFLLGDGGRSVTAAQIHPHVPAVALGVGPATLELWHVSGEEPCLTEALATGAEICSLCWSPVGDRLALGLDDGQVAIVALRRHE